MFQDKQVNLKVSSSSDLSELNSLNQRMELIGLVPNDSWLQGMEMGLGLSQGVNILNVMTGGTWIARCFLSQ